MTQLERVSKILTEVKNNSGLTVDEMSKRIVNSFNNNEKELNSEEVKKSLKGVQKAIVDSKPNPSKNNLFDILKQLEVKGLTHAISSGGLLLEYCDLDDTYSAINDNRSNYEVVKVNIDDVTYEEQPETFKDYIDFVILGIDPTTKNDLLDTERFFIDLENAEIGYRTNDHSYKDVTNDKD